MISNQTKNRLAYIDLLEFIAMSIVLISHCTTYQYDITRVNTVSTYINYSFRALQSTAVPLFFFANGYLLFNRTFKLKKHIVKTIKIIVLTVIWGFINVLLMMLIDHRFLSPKEILMAVWTWKQGWINQFWFMGVLVCIYLLFPVLKSAFDSNRSAFNYFVIICAVLTFGNKLLCGFGTIAAHELVGYPELIQENVFNMFNPFRGVYIWYTFVYFCCGGLAHLTVPFIRRHQKKYNIIAIAAILISMLLLTSWALYLSSLTGVLWDAVWGGQDSVFALMIVFAVFVLSLNYRVQESRFNKLVYLVSVNTLGIYYLHELFIHMFLNRAREIPFMQNIIGSFVAAACVMAMSLLAAIIIKKIPAIRKLLV